MRKTISLCLAFFLFLGALSPVALAQNPHTTSPQWAVAMNRSLDFIESTVHTPQVGSVAGEWSVLALARAGRINAHSPWLNPWYANLESLLEEIAELENAGHDITNPPSVGTFPSDLRRWTDFQRVTLALTALGEDATDFRGHDLTQTYRTFVPVAERHALNRTINVDTFALIALQTRPYEGQTNQFLQTLISAQRADGSFGLAGNVSSPLDLDTTAMAITALAPAFHDNHPQAVQAVNAALAFLREQTFNDPESVSQMIVALTALGQEFAEEAHYYVNLLLLWFDTQSGAFRRPSISSPINLMATEQAAYALVSYWRLVSGMTALYDMGDMFYGPQANRHAHVQRVPILNPGTSFSDTNTHPNRNAIEALGARGIILGRENNTFAPNDTMSRAEFATIVTRALGVPTQSQTSHFQDVGNSTWYTHFIQTAFYYQLINGTSPTTFYPHGTITHQEAAVMVTRAARLAGLNTRTGEANVQFLLSQFHDGQQIAPWARLEMTFLYQAGILSASTNMQPLRAITRGEIAQMLYLMLDQADLL